jgi:perosamine synthetase
MSTNLAIDGGRPVRSQMLPYARQTVDEEDIQSVLQVLRSDWLTTGPNVAKFERQFADKVGAQDAIAVSSGTAALHSAVFAAGIGAGDEVIVPAMTFVASANCVRYQGGTVVFADIRPDTLALDPDRVEAAITPRTRAIVTVDYTGQPSDLEELNQIAERHQLTLIEDAAHALGATYHGGTIGSLAHFSTFSFHPVKHITTGEGGMITTNDDKIAKKLRMFRNHGIASDHHQREMEGSWFYEMTKLGYNYRLSDFQCALGESQLKKLPERLSRRREIAGQYTKVLGSMPEIELPTVLSDRESAWHLYVICLNLKQFRPGRAEIFRALRAENIGVNVHYVPVPWHPYYQNIGYIKGQWPVAESTYERIISLPMWSGMTDQDVNDVIEAVSKVIHAYRD